MPPPPLPDDDQTAWLVTFSDLVLQLFAFVLVATVLGGAARSTGSVAPEPPAVKMPAPPPAPAPLPAPADADLAAVVPPRPPAPDELTVLGRRIRAVVDGADGVHVDVRDSDLVVTLNDTISFASGSAELLPDARPILREIAALAAAMPDFEVEVSGHTDDVPIHTGLYPSNLELSLARAASVVREMTSATPDLSARTVASGVGEHRPVAPNDDDASRARNRRVEVRLVRAPGARAALSAGE